MAIPLFVPEEYGPDPSASATATSENSGSSCSANGEGDSNNSCLSTSSVFSRLVHLLIKKKKDSIASPSPSVRQVTGDDQDHDDNNNNSSHFVNINEIRKKRRRHPAGPNGYGLPDLIQCHAGADVVPLPLVMASYPVAVSAPTTTTTSSCCVNLNGVFHMENKQAQETRVTRGRLTSDMSTARTANAEVVEGLDLKLAKEVAHDDDGEATVGAQLRQIADEIEVYYNQMSQNNTTGAAFGFGRNINTSTSTVNQQSKSAAAAANTSTNLSMTMTTLTAPATTLFVAVPGASVAVVALVLLIRQFAM